MNSTRGSNEIHKDSGPDLNLLSLLDIPHQLKSEILSLPPVTSGTKDDMKYLVNPRKSAPLEKVPPKARQPLGAGQEFAASEILSLCLDPETKHTYTAQKGLLAPHLVDTGLSQPLMLGAWPAPKSSRSNYAAFTKEQDLIREKEELAEWTSPSIQ